MCDGKLLYLVINFERIGFKNISTDYVKMSTDIQIDTISGNTSFPSGKYNVLEFNVSGASLEDLAAFVDLCNAHTEYLQCANFLKFFYSIINIFQLSGEQKHKNFIGLFGELSVIKHIYETERIDISMNWHNTGSSDKYDFCFEKSNVEVKSTTSSEKEITIKHEQIFNEDNNYLCVVELEVNNSGQTLVELITELRNAAYCNNYGFVVNVVKELKRVSYNEASTVRLKVKNINFYSADMINPLPCYPDNITKLSYKLNLSEFESNSTIADIL